MDKARLDPLRIGFPYAVSLVFPAGWLEVGETLRADLRTSAGHPDPLAAMVVVRLGDVVELSLGEAATTDLAPGEAIIDPVLVRADGSEYPIIGRLELSIEQHGTRPLP